MRNDLTDLTVVMDRSGSMSACKTDAEGGLNTFIAKQKELPGECTFSLIQFNTNYQKVHAGIPIKEVPHCTLDPMGSTALLDAVGRAIIETGDRLKGVDESQRPGLVVFVILTDGQENSSREFSRAKIKEMIEHQSSVYKWQFTYLGANQDAFAEAGAMGIAASSSANYAAEKTSSAFGAASHNVARMRKDRATGAIPCSVYTPEERKSMQ
jgi:hypothetical protein